MATARDIVTDALREMGLIDPIDPAPAAMASHALDKLNRLLDNWNADRLQVYADVFSEFTLVPNLNPHTIGPTGATFTLSQRPVSIEDAEIILTTVTPNVRYPLHLRDAQWYANLTIPAIKTSLPTDLFYNPTWPNGAIYLWPVPTTAHGLALRTRVVLAELTLSSSFSLPPGYRDAITLTLAESLAPTYGKSVPMSLSQGASRGRARIAANNDVTPTLRTQDSGMPGPGDGTRSNFNYRTGMLIP